MANIPHRKIAISVGTTALQLTNDDGTAYSVPANSQDVCSSITACNKINSNIAIDWYVINGAGNTIYKGKSITILAGATEELMDSSSRHNFVAGDKIFFISTVAASLDIVASFLSNS